MDRSKAIIRLEHWLKHAEEHGKEYKEFAEKLLEAGYQEASEAIFELSKITKESALLIKKALEHLKEA